jgi:3-hydroxyisobutyrate dehydrogenase-like beta-hydroxyacid dehydrogenase
LVGLGNMGEPMTLDLARHGGAGGSFSTFAATTQK